jgi:glyoxylase-like metal-dependent hydrolase (beta-lactamase superfamily II)
MLKIQKFTFNPFTENTYLVWCDEKNEAAVVDPGCFDQNEEAVLKTFIDKSNLIVKYLLNTHCHIDHVLGNNFIKETFNPEYFVPEKDIVLLEYFQKQCETVGIKAAKPQIPDKFITEDLNIEIGNIQVKFLFTPGHTPGEFCFYFESEKKCITGDVLFKGSIGRTDLWGGDFNTLMDSIKTKLLSLDDDVVIYPGHGEDSSIGIERSGNPFLKSI